MTDEVTEFWRAFEEELGEKIVALSEGMWFRLPESRIGHEGILVLTDKTFRFKCVPDTSRPFLRTAVSPETEDMSEFVLLRRDILSLRVLRAASLDDPLFRCSVVARGETGERTYEFSVDPSSGLLDAMGIAPAKGGSRGSGASRGRV
jgi:hypothetical protein